MASINAIARRSYVSTLVRCPSGGSLSQVGCPLSEELAARSSGGRPVIGSRRWRRPLAAAAAAACAGLLLASCSSSSGVHTQDPTSPATSTSGGSASTPGSSTAAASPSWTPPAYGSAAPAVDTVTKLLSAYASAVKSSRATSVGFDRYVAGQAKMAFDGALASARKAGVIYRGTPPTPRIVVTTDKSSASLPEVIAVNCPLAGPDPLTAYHVSTGKPVATPPAKVAPPYAQTAKVFLLKGKWITTSFTTDATKTCTR